MMKKTQRSKCCKAEVRADGMPDFLGSKEVCTVSYTCLKCKKPCNVVAPKGQKQKVCVIEKSKGKKIAMTKIRTALEEKQRVLTTKKRIKEGKKRLDFQGKMIQKLVEFFDGITIHPVKGVILTSKKKRQLVELQEMEQKLFKSKIKKPRE
jgi:hypothetical protein